jgi:hypothetical protein
MDLRFKGFYKYQLVEDFVIKVPFTVARDIHTQYISLTRDGYLRIKNGYAWDGASGPVIDTRSNMRGSLVHDALYQLMRQGYLDREVYREVADGLFRDLCIEDGVSKFRAWIWYWGVFNFGEVNASPRSKKLIMVAP